jgi:hypothetical protein
LPDDLLAIGLCLKSRTSFRHPDFIAGTTVPRPGGAEPMSRDPNFDGCRLRRLQTIRSSKP